VKITRELNQLVPILLLLVNNKQNKSVYKSVLHQLSKPVIMSQL